MAQPPPPNIPPGWHPDPDDATQLRYWDGTQWTEHRSPNPSAQVTPTTPQKPPLTARFAALKTWQRAAIITAFAVVGGAVMLADAFGDDDRRPEPDCVPTRYAVGGSASSASITMENASGNTEQLDPVIIPFNENLGCIPRSQFLYISAQKDGGTGTITCLIFRNGGVVAEAESRGAYAIASCSD